MITCRAMSVLYWLGVLSMSVCVTVSARRDVLVLLAVACGVALVTTKPLMRLVGLPCAIATAVLAATVSGLVVKNVAAPMNPHEQPELVLTGATGSFAISLLLAVGRYSQLPAQKEKPGGNPRCEKRAE